MVTETGLNNLVELVALIVKRKIERLNHSVHYFLFSMPNAHGGTMSFKDVFVDVMVLKP